MLRQLGIEFRLAHCPSGEPHFRIAKDVLESFAKTTNQTLDLQKGMDGTPFIKTRLGTVNICFLVLQILNKMLSYYLAGLSRTDQAITAPLVHGNGRL